MPWTHRGLRRQVSAYLDGELDRAAALEVERHLGVCWGCSGVAEHLRLIKASLRHLARRRPEPIGTHRLRRWIATLTD